MVPAPSGSTRPYSMWVSGDYPRALDGLTKLLDHPEPLGGFVAFVPGTHRQTNFPLTVTYVAQLMIHRYAMLSILETLAGSTAAKPTAGKPSGECGNHTMIREDGCDFCTDCGAVGTCG